MTVAPQAEQVRQLVIRTFSEFGVAVRSLFDLNEALLIEEGRLLARSYRSAGLMATWLIEIGTVQFYDASGNMLRTVNLLLELDTKRAAA